METAVLPTNPDSTKKVIDILIRNQYSDMCNLVKKQYEYLPHYYIHIGDSYFTLGDKIKGDEEPEPYPIMSDVYLLNNLHLLDLTLRQYLTNPSLKIGSIESKTCKYQPAVGAYMSPTELFVDVIVPSSSEVTIIIDGWDRHGDRLYGKVIIPRLSIGAHPIIAYHDISCLYCKYGFDFIKVEDVEITDATQEFWGNIVSYQPQHIRMGVNACQDDSQTMIELQERLFEMGYIWENFPVKHSITARTGLSKFTIYNNILTKNAKPNIIVGAKYLLDSLNYKKRV